MRERFLQHPDALVRVPVRQVRQGQPHARKDQVRLVADDQFVLADRPLVIAQAIQQGGMPARRQGFPGQQFLQGLQLGQSGGGTARHAERRGQVHRRGSSLALGFLSPCQPCQQRLAVLWPA
jgi:hypothetical protein